MKYSRTEMINNLEKNAFNFKKKFGQNFIIDENIIKNIIQKADIDENTLVIEIGPGAGSLTYLLSLSAKYVLCYEIDSSLKEVLATNLQETKNVDVIYQDFLMADVNKDIAKYDYKKIYIVANLPYYITTPIVCKIIEDAINIDKMVIMVQKEVGLRFKALPGSKSYNSLSVYLNYYFDIKKIIDVSRNVFIPKPNVDSIVLELKKKTNPLILADKNLFFQLVRDSFKQKRKTLKNNLNTYDLVKIEETLKKYNYDLTCRAEMLSLDVFVDMANNLANKK